MWYEIPIANINYNSVSWKLSFCDQEQDKDIFYHSCYLAFFLEMLANVVRQDKEIELLLEKKQPTVILADKMN